MRVQERERAGALALPSGDPAEIRAAAARFRRVAERALGMPWVQGQTVGELSRVWSGAAASLASMELTALAGRARALLPQLGEAAAALFAYAEALDEASARTRLLRDRSASAWEQHRRLVVSAPAGADPVTAAAVLARADELLAHDLATIHRAHDRAMEELAAAGTRCAQRLSFLTSNGIVGTAGSGGAAEAMLRGLPFARAAIESASQPPLSAWTAPEEQEWWEVAAEAVGDGAAWSYNHVAVPLVNGAANVVEAVAEHPEDLIEMALGAGMIIVGTGGEVAGVALDATGVGAVAGVPLNVAAAAAVAAGAGTVTHGASRLANHAAQNDNRLLKEVDGPSVGGRGQPGDPLPDSMRPELAGSSWKGRVADNGKGDVWQAPDRMHAPKGACKDADSIRLMDPDERYPHGYVRFYNSHGQVLTLDGKPGPTNAASTHIPVGPNGTFDIPKGWAP